MCAFKHSSHDYSLLLAIYSSSFLVPTSSHQKRQALLRFPLRCFPNFPCMRRLRLTNEGEVMQRKSDRWLTSRDMAGSIYSLSISSFLRRLQSYLFCMSTRRCAHLTILSEIKDSSRLGIMNFGHVNFLFPLIINDLLSWSHVSSWVAY